jgi:hypothetical protein
MTFPGAGPGPAAGIYRTQCGSTDKGNCRPGRRFWVFWIFLVPTLGVGTHVRPLCGPSAGGLLSLVPQSGQTGVPTRSVGTRSLRRAGAS